MKLRDAKRQQCSARWPQRKAQRSVRMSFVKWLVGGRRLHSGTGSASIWMRLLLRLLKGKHEDQASKATCRPVPHG